MQNEACSILFNNQHDYYNQPEQAMVIIYNFILLIT